MSRLGLVLALSLAACAGAAAGPYLEQPLASDEVMSPIGVMKVINVGLRADVAAPPLGTGIDPSLGRFVNGTGTVDATGTWSTGSIVLHGDQWLIPLTVAPGTLLSNVTCDVFTPSAAVTTTAELVANGIAIDSRQSPGSSSLVLRFWLQPASYVVPDGAQLGVRIGARDGGGAWASTTVVSCAVRAPRVLTMNVFVPVGTTPGVFSINVVNGAPATTAYQPPPPLAFPRNGGIAFPVVGIPVGSHVLAVRAKVTDNTAQPLALSLYAMTQPDLSASRHVKVADVRTSDGSGNIQTLSGPGLDYQVPSWTTPEVTFSSPQSSAYALIWMAEIDYAPPQ